MWQQMESGLYEQNLYVAGQRVPSGLYRHCASGRELRLDREDILPASLDGRVACYVRLYPWSQVEAHRLA